MNKTFSYLLCGFGAGMMAYSFLKDNDWYFLAMGAAFFTIGISTINKNRDK